MSKKSAGIVLYRFHGDHLEVLLAHPGGPLYTKKDQGVWSIPKGEYEDEDPLVAAKREFEEETGVKVEGDFIPLRGIRLKSGKTVFAFGLEKDLATDQLKSNDFEMEWPPKSGKKQFFPEIDRMEWFTMEAARHKVNPAQIPILEELEKRAT